MTNNSIFKSLLKLTKHSAIYGVGHVLTKSLVILLLPIHTNFVNQAEYGIATQLFAFLAIVAIIYSYGLNTAFLQFYIREKDFEKKKQFFATAFLSTAFSSIAFSIIIFLFREGIADQLFSSVQYSYLIVYSVGILSADALVLLSFNILRADERSATFATLSVSNVAINLVFNVIFVGVLKLGVKGIFLANLFSSTIIFILLLPLTLKYLVLSFRSTILIKMLKFGLPFILSTLSVVVINSVDRFFINKYLGLEATGIYGAGYKLGLVIKLFINAFQFAWLPFFMSIADQENAKQIFSKIFTYFALICSGIFLIASMYINQIVRISVFGFTIFGKAYWNSTQIVPVVLLAYIAYGFYINFIVGIYLKEKTKYLALITSIGALSNIVGNVVLIPAFGLMGAAFATAISFIIMAICMYFTSQKFYHVQYELNRVAQIILLAFFAYMLYTYVKFIPVEILKVSLILAYGAVLYLSGFFQPVEINKLKQVIKGFLWRS